MENHAAHILARVSLGLDMDIAWDATLHPEVASVLHSECLDAI